MSTTQPYIKWYHMLPKGQRLTVEQAPVDRDWMDNTPGGYAYRCLPMTYASRHGWCIRAPYDVEVIWGGGVEAKSTQIICGRYSPGGAVFADNGTGNGIVTFHINAVPRTPPEYSLWMMGGPNLVVPGASPLSGIVESDWTFASPTMNWKITDPDRLVTFKKGDPVFFFVPIHKTYLEEFSVEHLGLEEDEGIKSRLFEHMNWRAEKDRNNEAVFGKRYMRGQNPNGSEPDWPHIHKTKLKLDEPDANL